jgi:hypothetical protein
MVRGALACLAALGVVPAVAAGAATPSQAIAALNAQRAANGIPAGVVENPAWSDGCRLHNDYLRFNDLFEHDEDPTLPGYTPEGDAAGAGSVLARGQTFGDGRNPFDTAPAHLMQLLAPRLSVTGVNDAGGYVCMWTWAGYQRLPAPTDTLYSYPGDGVQGVPAEETAVEDPFVPGDFVGLAQGTTTGPHLYLLADGPWVASGGIASVAAASLVGPEGRVELRSVTNATPDIGPVLPSGAILIPARPLRPGSDYQAQVTLQSSGGAQVTRAWRFRTGRLANAVEVQSATVAEDRVEVLARSTAANATLRVEGARLLGGLDPIVAEGGSLRWAATVSGMPSRVCVASGGGADPHERVERCILPEGSYIAPRTVASQPGGAGRCVVRPRLAGRRARLVATGCPRGLVAERRVGRRWLRIRGAVRLAPGRRLVWRARLGARVVARGTLATRRR